MFTGHIQIGYSWGFGGFAADFETALFQVEMWFLKLRLSLNLPKWKSWDRTWFLHFKIYFLLEFLEPCEWNFSLWDIVDFCFNFFQNWVISWVEEHSSPSWIQNRPVFLVFFFELKYFEWNSSFFPDLWYNCLTLKVADCFSFWTSLNFNQIFV